MARWQPTMCGEICQGGTEDPSPLKTFHQREREEGVQTSEEEEKIPCTVLLARRRGGGRGELVKSLRPISRAD